MKTRTLILAAAGLLLALLAKAQPNPLEFNTGLDAALSSVQPTGSSELRWKVSYSIGSGYVTPRCVFHTGWASPTSQSGWITYPHNCTPGDTADHHCVSDTIDEYYRLEFNLPETICDIPVGPGVYCLNLDLWADNCVYQIFVNNTGPAVYQNPNVAPLNPAVSPYWDYGFSSPVNVTLCDWQPGLNYLIVHVKSGATNPQGWSGLMVNANLSTTTPQHVECDPPHGCCLGNICGKQQNPLLFNYEIPMNNKDFFFSGDMKRKDKVNIGLSCGNVLPGKLNVSTAVDTDPNNSGNSYGIYARNTNGINLSTNTGVYGTAMASGEAGNNERGIWGYASGGKDARGVFGQGVMAQNAAYGGYFESLSADQVNYGMYAIACNAQRNYAVYGKVCSVDNTGTGPNWAGYFDGDVTTTASMYFTSDKNLKTGITKIERSLDLIRQLNPVSYRFDNAKNPSISLPYGKQYGFISQEVNAILPDLTKTMMHPAVFDDEGKEIVPAKEIMGLNYNGFIAILTKGMQEQQTQIDDQKKQIEELKSLVQSMAGNVKTGNSSSTAVTLGDHQAVVLNQNVPNPFAESTVIAYTIPMDFTKAQILFTTEDGRVIKTVAITSKGEGRLNVFANDLSHGIYTYKLEVDGKVIDSKKMIKE